MTKVTITKIKDTQRTSAKTGRPFTSRAILVNEYGNKWLSGFAGKENQDWKEGDTVEIDVEQKGEYLNFSVPKATQTAGGMSPDQFQMIMRELRAVNANVLKVWQEVDPNKNITSAGTKVPDFSEVDELRAEDIGF